MVHTIIVHHSVSPRDIPLLQSLASFDTNHKARLHPDQNSLGHHIAYHYVIAGDGTWAATREESDIGYHASDYEVNKHSIGICLTGNFDNQKPTKSQMDTLKMLVNDIKKRHYITELSGHRDYSSKSCPGKNLTDAMLKDLLEDPFADTNKWGVDSGLFNGENLRDAPSRQELMLILNRLVKYIEDHYHIVEK